MDLQQQNVSSAMQAEAFEGWAFYALTYGSLTAVYLVSILVSDAGWQRPACN